MADWVEVAVGDQVRARTATGDFLVWRACSGIEPGHTFPVVWICSEEEWTAAQAEGRRPKGVAWPAEEVEVVEHAA